MKKRLLIFIVTVVITGCNSEQSTSNPNTVQQIAEKIIAKLTDFNAKNSTEVNEVSFDLEQDIMDSTTIDLFNNIA